MTKSLVTIGFWICLHSAIFAGQWTSGEYLKPLIGGRTFALNAAETKLYFEKNTRIFSISRSHPDSNAWSQPLKIDAPWNVSSPVLRNCWISPDEKILIFSRYTDNWDLFYSTKDDQGIWSSAHAFPPVINTKDFEFWASFSHDNRYLYFTRDISGLRGTLLRAEQISPNEFAIPETLSIGEYAINWGGDEYSCTLTPDDRGIIFSGYRYWYKQGRGNTDLFYSEQSIDGGWTKILRLTFCQDSKLKKLRLGDGIEKYPCLSNNGRNLYYIKREYVETDSGLTPVEGYSVSKRIWSDCSRIYGNPDADDSNVKVSNDNVSFSFQSQGLSNYNFSILNIDGHIIATYQTKSLASGQYQIIWYRFDEAGSRLPDGIYFLKVESASGHEDLKFNLI
ncbi:PD40 domain-containing protein [bacterium]|nr:PD40 domain-containing protein [bacterium]